MTSRKGVAAVEPSPDSAAAAAAARSTSPAQNTQAEVAGQTWHRLMWLPLILLFPAAVLSFRYVADMVAERTAYMASQGDKFSWSYPALGDLSTTFYSLLVLLFLRVTLCRFLFTPLGRWILPTVAEKKGKWTEAAREDRVQRFSVCLFKLCYFLCITAFGYHTLKDQSWLPPQLFGTGSVEHLWTDWPYSEMTDSVKTYTLIELSYHAHSLVFHLFTIHRNDFVEMTLHHTCAVLLVVFAYFANFVRVGSLVLFLHDIADVMAYAVKAVVDTKYTKITLTAYAGLLISWGYTRLYVFPFHVISATRIPGAEVGFVWVTSYFMIWLLQCLHIYWYTLFLIMGYRFAISGKTVDIQQKAGETDGSYVDYHKRNSDAELDQTAARQAVERVQQDQQQEEQEVEAEAEVVDETPAEQSTLQSRPSARSQKKSKRAE